MADKNNYTTIRIKESSRKKLEALREGTDNTFSDIIENLLRNVEGTMKDDIVNVHRENIALELQYYDMDNEKGLTRKVTFKELYDAKLGDTITANPNPSNHSTCETMEVIFKDTTSVLVRITETVRENGTSIDYADVIHFQLF